MRSPLRSVVLAAALVAALAGCVGGASPPSRYYLLAADPGLVPLAKTDGAAALSIAVGPVVVPEYLNRNQIVTRQTPYRIDLAEFDIWAEPLDENLARILVENLSRVLGTDHVLTFAERRGAAVDFEVAVDVERLDAVGGKAVEFVARWTVTRGREHVFTRRSRLHEPLADGRFETLAAAMSRAASELSVEIATAIGQLAG